MMQMLECSVDVMSMQRALVHTCIPGLQRDSERSRHTFQKARRHSLDGARV